jgi:diadenosine tetraphosphatase ApaH/serine/threonine PP2A family protein phosphatase
MQLALFSDIHANRQALDACLAHARGKGAERCAFLGDLVGYGGDPAYVVRRVMALAAQGALVVRGNHDHYVSQKAGKNLAAGHTGIEWTRKQLSAQELRFLAALPLALREGDMLLVHGSADAPANWRYVETPAQAGQSLLAACREPPGDAQVRYVFCGHVHWQTLYFSEGGAGAMTPAPFAPGVPTPLPERLRWLATVGSVGQPRDGQTEAMYALLDTTARRLTFHRVPYDVRAAMAAIRATPLPGFFADRLGTGK